MSDPYRPDILYHYTTQEGLLGILEKKVIYASSIQHLNDSSEFNYAVKVALRALSAVTELPTVVNEHLTTYLNGCRYGWDVFVSSFSTDGDQLGQWRAYGKDGGYCIGFDGGELDRLAVAQGYELRNCTYNDREHSILVANLLEKVVAKANNAADLAPASLIFLQNFLELAPTFKDRSFQAEQEWRISKLQTAPMSGNLDHEIKYRPGKSFYVPYKEFKLTDEHSTQLPIRMVYVGPTPHPELSAWTVRNHLQILGMKFDVVKVYPSRVPYRAW